MLIVIVSVSVRATEVDAFKAASVRNAIESRKEPGIARFDVIQELDDPTKFRLIEVYRSTEAPAQQKKTAHYQAWRDTVEPMMAEPRSSVKFSNVDPGEDGWDSPT